MPSYYLDIIKDYHGKIEMKKKYIFMYTTYKIDMITKLSKKAGEIFNYDVYYYQLNNNSLIGFGSNGEGQLGLSLETKECLQITQLPINVQNLNMEKQNLISKMKFKNINQD